MVAWTDQLLLSKRDDARDLSVLDLGTGNGLFVIRLAELGYRRLTGCDYSAASIALANAVALKAGATGIQWILDDILESGIQKRYSAQSAEVGLAIFHAQLKSFCIPHLIALMSISVRSRSVH